MRIRRRGFKAVRSARPLRGCAGTSKQQWMCAVPRARPWPIQVSWTPQAPHSPGGSPRTCPVPAAAGCRPAPQSARGGAAAALKAARGSVGRRTAPGMVVRTAMRAARVWARPGFKPPPGAKALQRGRQGSGRPRAPAAHLREARVERGAHRRLLRQRPAHRRERGREAEGMQASRKIHRDVPH
jgi:hypothetical protein